MLGLGKFLSAARLTSQIRNEVREVLRSRLLFESLGHHRFTCTLNFLDLVSQNHLFSVLLHYKRDTVAGLRSQHPTKDL